MDARFVRRDGSVPRRQIWKNERRDGGGDRCGQGVRGDPTCVVGSFVAHTRPGRVMAPEGEEGLGACS